LKGVIGKFCLCRFALANVDCVALLQKDR
jgi:hypothetical protein